MIGEILLASVIIVGGYQLCSGLAELLAERRQRKADEEYLRENPPTYCQCGHEDYQHLGYARDKFWSDWHNCAMCRCSHFQLHVNDPSSTMERSNQIKQVGEAIKRA